MTPKINLLELNSQRNHDGWDLWSSEYPDARVKDPILSDALAKLILLVRQQT